MTHEQKAVELVREYVRAWDEYMQAKDDSAGRKYADVLAAESNVRELGRKLLEADNEST